MAAASARPELADGVKAVEQGAALNYTNGEAQAITIESFVEVRPESDQNFV